MEENKQEINKTPTYRDVIYSLFGQASHSYIEQDGVKYWQILKSLYLKVTPLISNDDIDLLKKTMGSYSQELKLLHQKSGNDAPKYNLRLNGLKLRFGYQLESQILESLTGKSFFDLKEEKDSFYLEAM
ncbi:hypothetical protein HOA92_05520 [archaeon]|jgi:hypothetical protein|nr:hypothetical protein [archaeon]MBT6762472.1 hypothetical protein [archaeon]